MFFRTQSPEELTPKGLLFFAGSFRYSPDKFFCYEDPPLGLDKSERMLVKNTFNWFNESTLRFGTVKLTFLLTGR